MIDYIENPEKTVPNQDMQDFFDVFSYVKNPQKTNEGEYVSAVNCLKETALQQMILTKKQYQKTGGYIAWHGYQSFKPDEVTPKQCHEIGLKLAREMWGGKYQIIGRSRITGIKQIPCLQAPRIKPSMPFPKARNREEYTV